MSEDEPKQEAPAENHFDRIDHAIRKAMREAVLTHARLGQPVSTLRDGQVVWLSPEEVFALFANSPPK